MSTPVSTPVLVPEDQKGYDPNYTGEYQYGPTIRDCIMEDPEILTVWRDGSWQETTRYWWRKDEWVKRTDGPYCWETKACPCGCQCFEIHRFKELEDHFKDERAAELYIAERLTEAAEHLRSGKGWPGVYACDVPLPGEPMVHSLFGNMIGVILSNPWPG